MSKSIEVLKKIKKKGNLKARIRRKALEEAAKVAECFIQKECDWTDRIERKANRYANAMVSHVVAAIRALANKESK